MRPRGVVAFYLRSDRSLDLVDPEEQRLFLQFFPESGVVSLDEGLC